MPDGVGWSVWSNALGCEQVLFRWSAGGHGRLVVTTERYAHLQGGAQSLVLVDEHDRDETIDTTFTVHAGHDALGDPVTLLGLDQRISRSDRFVFVRRQLKVEDDPAGWTLR
jgi:hypothetical protein